MNKKNLILSMTSIIIISTVITCLATNTGHSIPASALQENTPQQLLNSSLSENSIPIWIRNVTKWWSEGQTSDSDFLGAIQYLIDKNILHTYQKSSLTSLSNQYNQTAKITDLQIKYNTLEIRYNELLRQLQNVTEKQQSVNSNTRVGSISAVAVYPIIQSDGFFQTTVYNGTILKITVDIRDGTGLVLANTAIPEGVDFQNSARIAARVAKDVTGVDLSNKDIIFSITTDNQNLQAVDGGSAGGAMTMLLTSAILGKPIAGHILMTGTIQQDGTIGPIGAVLEKAEAAANYGAKTFLVPRGQGTIMKQHCTQTNQGSFVYQYCSPQAESLSSIMESKYGMKVIEVGNIMEVIKYFTSP
jgi:uncharacterized protein